MTKQFKSVEFDDERNVLKILTGDLKEIPYADIEKASVANEDASFKGKSTPFAHQVLGGVTFMSIAAEPSLYVGIKLVCKDKSIHPIYVSDTKTQFNTDIYKKDREEAETIKKMIDKRI